MEVLFAGIKKLIYLYLFLTVFQQILPDNQYQKYVRFFSGLVFVAVILAPILQVVRGGDLLEQMEFEHLFQEMETVEMDYAYMDEVQQEYYTAQIQASVEEKVADLALEEGWNVDQVRVQVSDDLSAIEAVYVEVNAGDTGESLPDAVEPVMRIFPEDQTEGLTGESCEKLQERISVYFELEEGQVNVFET